MMKKFEFGKSYEEIDVAGEVFKVNVSDESMIQYQKAFEKFSDVSGKFSEQDIAKLSTDEQEKMLAARRENIKEITETILGEGTFEPLFEKAGRSTVNFMPLVFELVDTFVQKADTVHKTIENKYLKKKRK